jgi:peptide deformylase
MAKLTILEFPDPRLRTRAKPVETVDDSLRTLIDDMLETMYAAPGIGLAATQVDVHRRLLVADVSRDGTEPHALINPAIIEKDGVTVTEEGCLSVPGYYEEVRRAEHIRVRYLDRSARYASSTRWTTSTESCSSTTCPRPSGSAYARSWSKIAGIAAPQALRCRGADGGRAAARQRHPRHE